jgi:hypothetical protein
MTAAQLRNFTEAELKNLKAMITIELGKRVNTFTASLVEGQKVKINHTKTRGKVYVISKINRVKCVVVEQGSNMKYTVSYSLLEAM